MQVDARAIRVLPLPRPGRPTYERRRNRSGNSADALQLALTRAAKRGALQALILVDDDGMLVAQSDSGFDLSMLAAVTPIVGRGRAIPRIKLDGEPLEMNVYPVELHDELFYLAALGGTRTTRYRELAGSSAATKRILA